MNIIPRSGLLLAAGMMSFVCVHGAQAQRVSTVTAKALANMCSQKKGVTLCDAYLSGVMDSEVWSRNYSELNRDASPVAFCVPKQQKTNQVRNIVIAWLGAHTDVLSQPAGKAVYRALHENYPCGSTLQSSPSGGQK